MAPAVTIDLERASFEVTGETGRELTLDPVDGEPMTFEYIEPESSLIHAGSVDPDTASGYPILTLDVASTVVVEHLLLDVYQLTVVSDNDAVPDTELWAREANLPERLSEALSTRSPKV